jgi:anti-sigma B factor antagonist
MELSFREQDGVQILEVAGRLDASTSPTLQARFEGLASPEKRLFVLDLRGVDYVSSGGLRVLLVMTKQLTALGGGIALINLHPFVEDLLRLSGFHTLIPTAGSLEDAARLLSEGPRP